MKIVQALSEVKPPDPEEQRKYEGAYRRGLSHGLILAVDLADDAVTLGKACRALRRAANLAHAYRDQDRHPGRPPLYHEIHRKLIEAELLGG
jgi:hypothetical protein